MLIHIILLIIFIINALGIFAFIKQKSNTTSNLNDTYQSKQISTGMSIVYIILLILCSFGLYLIAQNMD